MYVARVEPNPKRSIQFQSFRHFEYLQFLENSL